MPTLSPVRRQILVGGDPADAYRLWVDDIGAWWPVEGFSCFGAGASVALVGDHIVETAPDGRKTRWAEVISTQHGSRLELSWHPGREASESTRVVVTFVAVPQAGTLVTLEHDGWQGWPNPTGARADYRAGWRKVMCRLADYAGSPGGADDVWLVLQHQAGPAAPPSGVMTSPDFALHGRFLRELGRRGILVAAGPLVDRPGSGMAVVHTPDAATAVEVVNMAQDEDGSVVNELLVLLARPWKVIMSS